MTIPTVTPRPARAELPLDARRAVLRASPIFAVLQESELQALLGHAVTRTFARGAAILRRGDRGRGMLVVLRGRVRVSTMLEDGREMTLSVVGPGDSLGEMSLLDGEERSADATALEDCAALVIDRAEFLRLLRASPDLCLRLIETLSRRLRATNAAMTDIALLDLPTRLGKVLLRLARDYGAQRPGGLRIELKLSQKDLSTLVGGSREKVNRTLRRWEDDGVIAKDGGYLVIRKPEALAAES
jgi:CRP/FNR family cyclic AMP-dependent transcriptional regulator